MNILALLPATATLAATLLAATPPAQAGGPMQRRLQIEAELVRDASVTGTERGRARLSQSVNLQVVLMSDGVPSPSNPLDPEDGRRLAEQGQRTQQKVQAALQRQGAAPADPQATMARAQASMAQAQALMARCGQDRDCLMREATAMSAAQAGRQVPGAQARMEAYGTAVRGCEKQHAAAAAREACIAQARRQAGASDDGEADEVAPTPYLLFTGTAGCQLDAATKIDERVEGSFEDVQGTVPFTRTIQAQGRERDTTLCLLMQAVLDTRSGRLWTHVLPTLRGVPGTIVRAEKGRRPQQADEVQPARWHEGQDWLMGRLANLSAGGTDRFERALPGGKLDLKLKWSFAPM
jgi:hypothetical protein